MAIVSTFLSITLNVTEFTFISKSKDKEWLKQIFLKSKIQLYYTQIC